MKEEAKEHKDLDLSSVLVAAAVGDLGVLAYLLVEALDHQHHLCVLGEEANVRLTAQSCPNDME
jgi:hypothetical protein